MLAQALIFYQKNDMIVLRIEITCNTGFNWKVFDVKITILKKVPEDKIGYLNKNDIKLEPAEEATYKYLLLFGFNIEVIIPTNVKGMSNPDILISGGIWEIGAFVVWY